MNLTLRANTIDSKSNKVYVSPKDFADLMDIDDIKYCNINGHFFPFEVNATVEAGTIQANSMIRETIKAAENESVAADIVDYDPSNYPVLSDMQVSIRGVRPYYAGHKFSLSPELIATLIRSELAQRPVREGDKIFIQFEITGDAQNKHYLDTNLFEFIVTIDKLTPAESIDDTQLNLDTIFGKVLEDTECEVKLEKHFNNHSFKIEREAHSQFLTQIRIDWKKMGVGGLDEQVQTIIDELFLPRAMSPEEIKQYGITFNKGALLYGPPGTGKTLIARKLSQMFTNKDKITLVNGPELKIKWVGESEENLRKVFAKAKEEWEEKGEKSDIHVFIFDEIDGLFPRRRNSDSGSKVEEGLVNQMLTLIDGVDSPQNILVFGLTNRIDIIDDALLRKGRLGVHIEIGLPDELGRRQILEIHTKAMREHGLLEVTPDYLDKLAKRTENWSGSELAALARTAANHSIKDNFDVLNNNMFKRKRGGALAKVKEEHFERAMLSITPQNGVQREKIDPILKERYFLYSSPLRQGYRDMMEDIDMIEATHHVSLAVFGEPGTGKTSLAVQLANASGAKSIEMIQAKDLVMQSEKSKKGIIEDAFHRARQSPYGVVILDGLKDILGAAPNGNYFSNELRIYLKNKLTEMPEHDRKLLIITTCDDKDFFEHVFGIQATCNNFATVDKINSLVDIIAILTDMGIEIEDQPRVNQHIKSMSMREFLYRLNKYLDGDESIRLDDFLESQNLYSNSSDAKSAIHKIHAYTLSQNKEYIPYLGEKPGKRPVWLANQPPHAMNNESQEPMTNTHGYDLKRKANANDPLCDAPELNQKPSKRPRTAKNNQ